MAARVHILTGPAGSGKTARLLERCRAVEKKTFATTLWLGPSRRALEAVRERLLDQGAGCLGVRLLTFQDLAEEVIRLRDPGARPLSNVQRRLLIDSVIAEVHDRGEMEHFRGVVETSGFGDGVQALVAELQRRDISAHRFARAAYRRGYSGTRVARTHHGQVISRKERECCRIYARYQRHLARRHLLDQEGRLGYARDLLARDEGGAFAGIRAVFVDGVTELTPPQHDLLAALARWVEEVWLALPGEGAGSPRPYSARAELFALPQVTLTRLAPLGPEVESLAPAAGAAPPAESGFLPFAAPDPTPAGLRHLERQLFRPLRAVEQVEDATGILCLEAPGMLGEARLVARHIKTLLLEGTPAEDVLVVLRDLAPYADLLQEVFAEYGIPVDVEGTEPLLRTGAVTALLRALRLPDDDWPFAGVTALLRSGYFRPAWPETQADADVAQHAEVLLRLLGEPRHREAYRGAVRRWVEDPPAGLEDEQAEESRRARTHELAKRCQPFLERFFHTWEQAPHQAPLAAHVAWMRRLADELGLPRAAAEDPRDRDAWQRFLDDTEQWLRIDRLIHGGAHLVNRKDFLRRLGILAATAGRARTPRGPGRVRILSAELAQTLTVPHLFLMGLGERGFPLLAAPETVFDEQERQAFKQVGVDFASTGDLMPREMLLFYQVVTRARRRLVLSYPAVDTRGQALLPSSFLELVLECFTPGAVPVERRSMLIERYQKDIPLSPAEHRVRVAASAGGSAIPVEVGVPALAGPLRLKAGLQLGSLPADVGANVTAAALVARLRFHDRQYNPYDGLFRHPDAIAAIGELFGPERVFSPTALEDYIACPFRFFLGHVLHLETLEEPREEIEVTRRGQAFHRALSRLHTQLKAEGVHQPGAAVDEQVLARLTEAVEEYVTRAPSPASKMLWRLEGQRLNRVGRRYRGHWQKFVEPWLPAGIAPRPHFFEVDFGLPVRDGAAPMGTGGVTPPLLIRWDGVEVRVSGRIDRVDVADLADGVGFWIIDYKTGRSSHYTGSDLREFRRLQLTLYALAVEQVLLADRSARPLGLAYWLVAENGPKIALPGKGPLTWFQETERWRAVREQLQRWVATLAEHIRRGVFALRPRSEHCTQTCDFAQICRITQSRSVEKDWHLPLPGVGDQ